MNSHEDKSCGAIKKKKFRSRKNPKQRKFKKKKQKKLLQLSQREQTSCMKPVKTVDYGKSFWSNYERAMKWQNNCLESYWKEQARRLQLENSSLRQRLVHLSQGLVSERNRGRVELHLSSGYQHQEEPVKSLEPGYEVTDEFMEFIETSLRHKETLKKDKEKVKELKKEGVPQVKAAKSERSELDDESCDAPEEDTALRRNKEMKLLYGGESPKIQGMETAMHLSFMRKCDRSKPVMWPVVPLSHSFSAKTQN